MRGGDQVLRIGRVRTSRMQGDVAGRSADAAVIIVRLVIGVGRHQQRLARQVRIGMLAVHFLELLRAALRVALLVRQEQAFVVELFGGLLDEGVVLLGDLVPDLGGRAARAQHRARPRQGQRPRAAVRARPSRLQRFGNRRCANVIRFVDIEFRPDAFHAHALGRNENRDRRSLRHRPGPVYLKQVP